jgi:hypothetical protein
MWELSDKLKASFLGMGNLTDSFIAAFAFPGFLLSDESLLYVAAFCRRENCRNRDVRRRSAFDTGSEFGMLRGDIVCSSSISDFGPTARATGRATMTGEGQGRRDGNGRRVPIEFSNTCENAQTRRFRVMRPLRLGSTPIQKLGCLS